MKRYDSYVYNIMIVISFCALAIAVSTRLILTI